MHDRRFDARWTLDETVELQWQTATGETVRAIGKMEDLSITGARIRLDRPIRVPTPVVIIVHEKQFRATVRNCIRTPRDFVAGVEFKRESQGILRTLRKKNETVLTIRD